MPKSEKGFFPLSLSVGKMYVGEAAFLSLVFKRDQVRFSSKVGWLAATLFSPWLWMKFSLNFSWRKKTARVSEFLRGPTGFLPRKKEERTKEGNGKRNGNDKWIRKEGESREYWRVSKVFGAPLELFVRRKNDSFDRTKGIFLIVLVALKSYYRFDHSLLFSIFFPRALFLCVWGGSSYHGVWVSQKIVHHPRSTFFWALRKRSLARSFIARPLLLRGQQPPLSRQPQPRSVQQSFRHIDSLKKSLKTDHFKS